MENIFHLRERNTTVRQEVIAGVTTFMAMAYILMVNPGMLSATGEASFGAIYIATALGAVVGTVLIGLLANLPLAQASGMGLNAYFVYSICFGLGFTYQNALVFVLFDGILFIILTVTGLRAILFNAVPPAVKKAIPAGIGLFIAFLGLQDAGIVVADSATGVTLTSFNLLGGATWGSIMPKLITIGAVIAITVMSIEIKTKDGFTITLKKPKRPGAILWGILGATVIYYLLGFTVPGFYDGLLDGVTMNPIDAFRDWGSQSFLAVFTSGFDFSGYLAEHSQVELIVAIASQALAMAMCDMFDTMGTLYGACRGGDLLEKNPETGEEEVPKLEQAMLADAVATASGAVFGTSTVTTYVESSAGVAAGGRTGLTSMVTAGLFAIAMFLSPIAALIPSCAYAAALVFVGVLMIIVVLDIDWKNLEDAVPAFVTVIVMPFTYNISYGIAFGLIFYLAIKLGLKKAKETHWATWAITIAFLIMFFVTH